MSGIVLKFTGLNSMGQTKCQVTYSKKRKADDLGADFSAANPLKYTPDEMEAAQALILLATGEPSPKRVKLTPAGSPRPKPTKAAGFKSPQPVAPSQDTFPDITIIKSIQATRKQRTVDPANPVDALLIAATPKAGSDIYNSDDEDHPSPIDKHNLFRNVRWGPSASDYSSPDSFPTTPDFQQFVPGRFERLPDGSLRDQKHKLLVKLTSKDGRKLIFKNPPPKDWTNQKAMTALNKRISQQIRRNTDVRFREEVEPYVREEREWICKNLVGGKPVGGWKAFVKAFNERFEGEQVDGVEGVRPGRSHSSLTKEIERFGEEFYKVGKVPVLKGEKAKREKEGEKSEFEKLVEKSKRKMDKGKGAEGKA